MYMHLRSKINKRDSLPSSSQKFIGLLAGLVVTSASLQLSIANAAPIYKVIDEKTGQVTFTDRPQSYEQKAGKQVSQIGISTGAETIGSSSGSTSASTSTSNNAANNQPSSTTSAGLNTTTKVPTNYQLTMIEPSEERAYRRPVQNIDVNIQVKPALQAGDSVSIYLDENEVAQGLNASIATVDILPGVHSIKAVVKSDKGQILKRVERTVHVIQNTQTLQKDKKIAEQLLAYQRLPWHQKVLLKMRQKENNQQHIQNSQPVTNDAFAK